MTESSAPSNPSPGALTAVKSDFILEWVLSLLLAATLLLSFLQVIARYLFQVSTPWSEELARLLFVWGVFLGAAVGVRRDLHTRVDFLSRKLPPRLSARVRTGMDFLLAGMALVMVIYGAQLVFSTRADLSTSLGYPRNWFYIPVPFSGLLMLRHLIPNLSRSLFPNRCNHLGRKA
jgi:TRAP-type C4-dicarboxylate transport system permease small subunit